MGLCPALGRHYMGHLELAERGILLELANSSLRLCPDVLLALNQASEYRQLYGEEAETQRKLEFVQGSAERIRFHEAKTYKRKKALDQCHSTDI